MTFDIIYAHIPGARTIYLNASSLKAAVCERKYAWIVNGYKNPDDDTTILDMGSAVHKFAEMFSRNGGDAPAALIEALKQFPHVPRAALIAACAGRSNIFLPPPLMISGELATEVTFEIPWLAFTFNGTTYQIVICGTIDHLSHRDGAVRIYDYKTTRYAMIDYAIKKYENETQFKFYMWALRKFKSRLVGLPLHVCNDIDRGLITSQVVIVQLSGKSPKWFVDQPRGMTDEQFQSYEDTLFDELERLIQSYLNAELDPFVTHPNGILCNGCQYCPYIAVCHAPNRAARNLAFGKLTRTPYNPLRKDEDVS